MKFRIIGILVVALILLALYAVLNDDTDSDANSDTTTQTQ